MGDEVQQILAELDELRAALPIPDYVGVAFVARKMGVSAQHLRNRPWLLPDWGRTEVPGRNLWALKTVRRWFEEATPADRDRQWQRLSPREKAAFTRRRAE